MPAATTTASATTSVSDEDIQVLYQRLTTASKALTTDDAITLRIALSRAGAAEPLIRQEPPPPKKRRKVKKEPRDDSTASTSMVVPSASCDLVASTSGEQSGVSTVPTQGSTSLITHSPLTLDASMTASITTSQNGALPSPSVPSISPSSYTTRFTGSYTPHATGNLPSVPSHGQQAQPSDTGVNGFGPPPAVSLNQMGVQVVPEPLGPDDVPPPPPHPTDPDEIRKLMRTKMHRCKRCKNRFVELNLLERHLRDKHTDDYILFMEEQAREMEMQRQAEVEQSKREEIMCGGFIPPLEDIDAQINYSDLDPNAIPLPGEETGGAVPTFDRWGGIRIPRRKVPYKKKVSPQCPFCDKRFRNENSLKKHIAKKHPDYLEFVQCHNCYKCLPNQDSLKPGGHACELLYLCFECVPIRNMCNQDRLDSHRSKFHRGKNSGFMCRECNRKFLTPRKLRKHRKMAHVITKPWKCSFCDEYYPSETTVSLHERGHTGVIKFECNICDFRTNRFMKLKKHKQEEHGYLCSICHEKMTEWSELKYHTLEKHGGYLSSESQAVCIESPRVWVLYKGE